MKRTNCNDFSALDLSNKISFQIYVQNNYKCKVSGSDFGHNLF